MKALVIQGGGFRTAFSAGVLDTFLLHHPNEFDLCIGVSGGSIALSFYLSQQFGQCYKALKVLADDPHFVQYTRAFSQEGFMDIDYLEKIAKEIVPFDLDIAVDSAMSRIVQFVATDRETGQAEYLRPSEQDWFDLVIASSTLPYFTKGVHQVQGRSYFDGGWSDPIPVEYAVRQGATEVLVVRTTPIGLKFKQSWPDYLGSIYHRSNPELSTCLSNAHERFNQALDFMADAPNSVNIVEIAPETALRCGTLSYSEKTIVDDYRHGLELGARYCYDRNH